MDRLYVEQDIKFTLILKAQGFRRLDSFALGPQTQLWHSVSILICPKGFFGVDPVRGQHLGCRMGSERCSVLSSGVPVAQKLGLVLSDQKRVQ